MSKKILFWLLVLVAGSTFGAEWNAETAFADWSEAVALKIVDNRNTLKLQLTGNDSSVANSKLSLPVEQVTGVEIEYRAKGLPAKTTGQIFFILEGQKTYDHFQYWRLPSLISDNQWHTISMSMPGEWTKHAGKKVRLIRLDMADQFPGSVEIRRINFKQKSRPAWNWTRGNKFADWGTPVAANMEVTNEYIKLDITGSDSSITNRNVDVDVDELSSFFVEYRAQGLPAQTTGQLFYAFNDQKDFVGNQYWRLPSVISDGKWHRLELNCVIPETIKVTGTKLDKVRLDLVDQFPGQVEIRKIGFGKGRKVEAWKPVKSEIWPKKKEEKLKFDRPYFSGRMLRSAADNPGNHAAKKSTYAFRREFDVPGDLEEAIVQFTADNYHEFFINGTRVSINGDPSGWSDTKQVDITGLLKPGRKNIAAGFYANGDSYGGILMEITMNRKSGTSESVVSDKKFRSILVPEDRSYMQVGFDDSAWPEMIEGNPPPAYPWNIYLPFKDIARRNVFKVESVTVEPATVNAGEKFTAKVVVSGRLPDKPHYMTATIYNYRKVIIQQQGYDITPSDYKDLGGGKYELTFEFTSPRYFSDAEWTFALSTNAYKLEPAAEKNFFYKSIPLEGPRPSYRVEKVGDKPMLTIDGKPEMMMIGNWYEAFRDKGIANNWSKVPMAFRSFWCRNGGEPTRCWHIGEHEYDFTVVDRSVNALLTDDPNAKIMIWVGSEMPEWWGKLYPDEMTRHQDGTGAGEQAASFASERFLADAIDSVTSLIRYCQQAPYANRIAGFLLTNGVSCEWQHWGGHDAANRSKLYDYSRPAQEGFKKFLSEKYPQIPEDQRVIPAYEDRLKNDGTVFLPENDGKRLLVVAYNHYLSEMMSGFLCKLSTAAKAAAGDMLIGAYYGYTFEYANITWALQIIGHNGLKKVLDTPAIDFLMSPPSYGIRNLGDGGEDMKPFASIAASGKLSIIDDDTRTHHSPPASQYQTVNRAQTRSILRRNFARTMIRQEPLCMLPIINDTDFGSPETVADLKQIKKIAKAIAENPPAQTAEVAVVISERSHNVLALEKRFRQIGDYQNYRINGTVSKGVYGSQTLTGELIYHQRRHLAHLGIPVDYILAEDLERVADKPYKLWIFLNAFNPDENFVRTVKKLQTKNTAMLWCYAPGQFYCDQAADSSFVKSLTGFDLENITGGTEAMLEFADGTVSGAPGVLEPMFAVKNAPGVQKMAVYQNDSDHTAMAWTKVGNADSIFVGGIQLNEPVMVPVLEKLGIHRYCESSDVIHANSKYLLFHAASSGAKTIKLPQYADVLELFSGKVIARNVKEFSINSQLHDTYFFYIGKASDWGK